MWQSSKLIALGKVRKHILYVLTRACDYCIPLGYSPGESPGLVPYTAMHFEPF